MRTEVTGYHPLHKVLHWLTALIVLTTIPMGLIMIRLEGGSTQNTLFDLHRSFGVMVLALTILRLAVRGIVGAPGIERTIEPWQRQLASVVHGLLYMLLFIVPLLGWTGTSAYGARISVFWLFELPMILPKDEHLATTLLTLHQYAAFTLTALLFVHAAAALYHHFIRGDEVLNRMLRRG
ncbi:cytochrome b561 [Rhodoligotrophos appendicifer]|uniref:cytochrome b n=1 Tax=Rhodoligotrophos appendicifer TaxID=987056 RepID=UPI001FE54782|nr:cytochrome b [Rhodoligotrophos appendicifer]